MQGPTPPPLPPERTVSIGAVVGGLFLVPVLSLVAFLVTGSLYENPGLAFPFLVGVPALVGGGLLLFVPRNSPPARGFGIGMMVSWAALSIFTAGLCTGLNPSLY